MKRKDYEPIKFEIFQTDMETYMHFLDRAILTLSYNDTLESYASRKHLEQMKADFQHKINCHIERGDWV